MTTLALYSNKGGVGKTTAAVNLSYLAAQSGAKTLICDLDPQSSATYYFRVKPKLKSGHRGFIKGGKQVYKSVKGTDYENLDLLPADFSLRNLDITFDKLKRSKKRLRKILSPFKNEYDLILLDCPVTISILAENIFNAVDYTLVPLIPTTLSVRTLKQLLSFCKKNKYDVAKIYTFFSMVGRHKKMHRELMVSVAKEFRGVLPSAIPYSAQIEKMGIHREPLAVFCPHSEASKSYQQLWDKVQETMINADRHTQAGST
ncbi:MAG: AAA family ATPase [Deltaproteobacteria bacterium]|nr:MAG: AAA family ATPase [Deltaproteobacteria bacterium]